jgi:hypothetical protein
MMVKLGYGLESPEIKNLIEYFKNYLVAMQLNDDGHDWEEDMQRGHLSTVVVMLLQDLNWPKKEIDLAEDLEELKKVFWFKTLSRCSKEAVKFAERSRRALGSISVLEDFSPLERFINLTENPAKEALKEQADSVEFLQGFKT